MCGIAGFYHSSLPSEKFPETIKSMLGHIIHRGPDEAGYYIDDHIAMGTVRLSIIDLKSGQQPISDQTQRYWICYNGEVYNYKELRAELESHGVVFQTSSDTEVVLQSWVYWGEACLTKLNGAYGFAIYDREEHTLYLIRDRYGKRTLFYTVQNGELLFASEMKAFLGHENFSFSMDSTQLSSVLALWTPLPDQSGYQNVKQLPMSEYLVVKGDTIEKRTYEALDFHAAAPVETKADALDRVREVMHDSVKLRMRSDVEVGVYLSGGLDSSIITSLVTEQSPHQVHSFSVEFESKEFDESTEQQEAADFFGTKHSKIRISNQDIVDNFPKAVFHGEIPCFRTAFVPMYLLSKVVQDEGIKVCLTGEGADEAFLGYNIFKETLLRSSWNDISMAERKQKLGGMYPYLKHFSEENLPKLMGLYDRSSVESMPGLFSHEMRFQNGRFSARLMKQAQDPFEQITAMIARDPHYAGLSAVQKAQWLEFKTLLSGYLLSTQGDRMSMAHSIENRCPFLDPNVIALSNAVNLKFDDGFDEKHLLKQAFKNKVPHSIFSKKKQPYRAPDSSAFIHYKPDYLELLLSDNELSKVEILNTKFARAFLNKIMNANPEDISSKENQTFIFLVSMALLHRNYVRREGLNTKTARDIDAILIRAEDFRQGAA
ncbi:MAG: asparagine synthase (glutamine-hydrolyzing) [Algicola sp.]|nr:asparagine synthase (glutamine-hydrolyzing) [Algicola sp.]